MKELEQQARDWADGKSPVTQEIVGRQYIWNLFSHNSPQYQDNGYNEEVRYSLPTPTQPVHATHALRQ